MDPVKFPQKLKCLFDPEPRYIVLYGGRGGAKSWGVARALLIRGANSPIRILCSREIQRSIGESVHQLLSDQIKALNLEGFYEILNNEIRGKNGTLFMFGGLKHNIANIKSKEGIDVVWVEEAEKVTKNSWDTLIPTIRKPGSQIIVTFNPDIEESETYQRFVVDPPESSIVEKLTYRDNPWFPDVLDQDRIEMQKKDPVSYDNVWEGNPRAAIEGAVYKKELDQAREEGRITTLEYDASKPCNTYWDIGHADCMSIWIEQKVGQNRYLIDFIQGQYEKVPYYIDQLHQKGYNYSLHVLPHDAKQDRANAEFTTHDMVAKAFPNARVHVNPNFAGAVKAGIQAVRNVFPFLYFDKERCREGLYSLKMYHYRTNHEGRVQGETPSHDFSDAPDALRMLAMAFRQSDKKAPSPKKKHSIYAR